MSTTVKMPSQWHAHTAAALMLILCVYTSVVPACFAQEPDISTVGTPSALFLGVGTESVRFGAYDAIQTSTNISLLPQLVSQGFNFSVSCMRRIPHSSTPAAHCCFGVLVLQASFEGNYEVRDSVTYAPTGGTSHEQVRQRFFLQWKV